MATGNDKHAARTPREINEQSSGTTIPYIPTRDDIPLTNGETNAAKRVLSNQHPGKGDNSSGVQYDAPMSILPDDETAQPQELLRPHGDDVGRRDSIVIHGDTTSDQRSHSRESDHEKDGSTGTTSDIRTQRGAHSRESDVTPPTSTATI